MKDHDVSGWVTLGLSRRLRRLSHIWVHGQDAPMPDDIALITVLMLMMTVLAGALFSATGLAMIDRVLTQAPV